MQLTRYWTNPQHLNACAYMTVPHPALTGGRHIPPPGRQQTRAARQGGRRRGGNQRAARTRAPSTGAGPGEAAGTASGPGFPAGLTPRAGAAAMPGAAMQAPLAGLALTPATGPRRLPGHGPGDRRHRHGYRDHPPHRRYSIETRGCARPGPARRPGHPGDAAASPSGLVARGRLQGRQRGLQPRRRLRCDQPELVAAGDAEHGHGVECLDDGAAIGGADDDVARQQQADGPRSAGQRPMRKRRVAGAQDDVLCSMILAELLPRSVDLHIDLGQHAEALRLGARRRRRSAASANGDPSRMLLP